MNNGRALDIVSDLFNGSFFLGNQIIRPADLQEGSEVYKEEAGNRGKTAPWTRDVKKLLKSGGKLGKCVNWSGQGDGQEREWGGAI